MARRNFYEILNGSPLNLKAEYNRIYALFYKGTAYDGAVVDIVDEVFEALPPYLRGRAITLSDFDETYGFSFSDHTLLFEPDDLILLCEYIWNLCNGVIKHAYQMINESDYQSIDHLLKIVDGCIKDMQHIPVNQNNIIIFVPKDANVVAVTEIVKEEMAVSILEYHHHGLKGNLAKKKAILKLMADDIESNRQDLRNINKPLEAQLFQLMNKFVRHDHSKTPYIAGMRPAEIEQCYDDIYQMWLLAKLEMDHYATRKSRIATLLEQING